MATYRVTFDQRIHIGPRTVADTVERAFTVEARNSHLAKLAVRRSGQCPRGTELHAERLDIHPFAHGGPLAC